MNVTKADLESAEESEEREGSFGEDSESPEGDEDGSSKASFTMSNS